MKDVRTQAAIVLGNILRDQGSLATLLPEASEQVDIKDRALLKELCYGVCRWQPRLQAILGQLLEKSLRKKDSDIQALLLIGLYQLVYLRVPNHAALDSTVEAAKKLKKAWATKLVNGVLRRFLREREALEQNLTRSCEYLSAHPTWLFDCFQQHWPEQANAMVEANNAPPPFTLRVNLGRISRREYQALLQEQNIESSLTPVSDSGLTLTQAIAVNELPGFERGLVSVQDEAPQLCAGLLNCKSQHRVLDACSAPGGKTAHLLEHYPDIQLQALDISERRAQRIHDNLQRLGLQADVFVADATQPHTWWDGVQYDRILVDAPCSATGIIRRQPDIKILRNADSLTKLVHIQAQLLESLWSLLKPGGELLYATCSIMPMENANLIKQFIAKQGDAKLLPINCEWGIDVEYGRQLLPRLNGHDGFFYSHLMK